MSNIKKVWLSDQGADLFALTLESSDPTTEHPFANSLVFPKEPSEKHPLRRTLAVGLFDYDDLMMIRNAIDEILEE